ncbi:MAG: UDP-N-acetylmuramate dehydrogenase [Bacteroidota bacterium]|nr:UDP-N-acetylmuramate dehydrogenase [Bacteroidota bacterium]
MLQIKEHVNLKPYNTFGIEVCCSYFIEINTEDDFFELVKNDIYKNNPKLIIGGGSNILFTKDFDGIVIKNNLKGISIVGETTEDAIIMAKAGEIWHEFVIWCIEKNYSGLENLSLIPGCVGASPMQNIGAYGVEIKDVFYELEALDIETGKKRIFKLEECRFGYRESVFKHELKNKFLICSVSFKLKKKLELNTSYGAINEELVKMGVSSPSIKDVSNAVIQIRQSKLPDPRITGNAGSFFKNPEVSEENYLQLKQKHPNLVAYPLTHGKYKLAAGWLIEQCGLKGFEMNGAAVHDKQALVLINKNNCNGNSIYELSTYVLQKVFNTFGVTLEREVNIN